MGTVETMLDAEVVAVVVDRPLLAAMKVSVVEEATVELEAAEDWLLVVTVDRVEL